MNANLTNAIDNLNSTNRFANRHNDSFDKEAWKEQKQKELTDTFAQIDVTVTEMFSTSDAFRQYLDLQTQLPSYRAGNVLLILAQRPDAIEVDTFDGWSKQHVSINAGERGFKILVPVTYTRDTDGQQGIAFRVTTAFDISQTSAAKPDIAEKLNSAPDAPDMGKLLNALVRRSSVPIEIDSNLDSSIGATFSAAERAILVRPDVDDKDAFIGIARCMARADSFLAGKTDPEFELAADAAAYLVCRRYGVDISSFAFDGLAEHRDNLGSKTKQMLLNEARSLASIAGERMEATLHPPKREQCQQER